MLALYVLYRDTNIETLQDGYETSDVLDQWIMSRMHVSQRIIQDALDRYHIDQAIREIDSMVDDLSTWYVRRSRDRIKDKDVSAQYTFYTVLKTYARVLAPFTPFVAEELWQALRHSGDVESVHLATWPEIGSIANYVIDQMKTAREYVARGLEARQRQNIKVRQPLALLEVCGEPVDPEYVALIMDEVNVKKVTMTTELLQEVILDTTLTPALVHEGIVRECIRAIQDMRKVSGCVPEDVIQITIDGPLSLSEALAQDSALIQKVCGATAVIFASVPNGALVMLGDQECRIAIERI
jgi:isoleucyl-tRNA synthetase